MILCVDPSDTRHAWALIRGLAERPELVLHGRDLMAAPEPWTREYAPHSIICEMVACYGMAAGAHLFDTCVEIGKLCERFAARQRIVHMVTRTEVKLLICGQTRAKDANVRAAIIDRFGGPSATKRGGQLHGVAGDTWAAIAVGLAAMEPSCRFYVPAAERAKA